MSNENHKIWRAMPISTFADIDKWLEKSTQDQSQNCDFICAAGAKDDKFVKNQLNAVEAQPCFEVWNAMSIGNIACLALHAPDKLDRERSLNLLDEYKNWRNDQKCHDRWNLVKSAAVGAALMMAVVFFSSSRDWLEHFPSVFIM